MDAIYATIAFVVRGYHYLNGTIKTPNNDAISADFTSVRFNPDEDHD